MAPSINPEQYVISSVPCSTLTMAPKFEVLYAAANRWPALRLRYALSFDGIPLNSAEAAQERAQQDQLRALANARPPLVSDLPGEIELKLADAEKGRWQAWWQLTCYLKLTPESRGWGDELGYFITKMPGWAYAGALPAPGRRHR